MPCFEELLNTVQSLLLGGEGMVSNPDAVAMSCHASLANQASQARGIASSHNSSWPVTV